MKVNSGKLPYGMENRSQSSRSECSLESSLETPGRRGGGIALFRSVEGVYIEMPENLQKQRLQHGGV